MPLIDNVDKMILRFSKLLRGHFERHFTKSRWEYFWRVWIETLAVAYLVAWVTQRITHSPPRGDLAGYGPISLVVMAVILGPLFETLVFQCLPMEAGQTLRFSRPLKFAVSIVPFSLAHFFAGIPTVVSAGVVGGFYFALTYYRWKRESLLMAILMTWLLHASFNATTLLAMFLFHL